MTSRFFFFVLFFGSDGGGGVVVVVVVVWRHPEALLFSVCVLADDTLSLSYSVIKSSNRAMAAALSALISSVVWRKVGSLASRGGV